MVCLGNKCRDTLHKGDDDDGNNNNNNNKSDQDMWKARHPGTTEKTHTGHFAHTSGSTNVEVQNIQHGKSHLHVPLIATAE